MIWIIIALAILVVCIIILIISNSSRVKKKVEEKNQQIQKVEQQLEQKRKDLIEEQQNINDFHKKTEQLKYGLDYLHCQLEEKERDLKAVQDLIQRQNQTFYQKYSENQQIESTAKKKIEDNLNDFKKITSSAAQSYFERLEKDYQTAAARYRENLASLNGNLTQVADTHLTELYHELDAAAADLKKLKETRKAAYEAVLKEQQVKENKKFYSVQLDKKYEHDIYLLTTISLQLIDPRPVNMIIWSTYYSKKVNELCSRIIGTEDRSGIYKITFLPTNQCYIGQAKNLKERIRSHIKAGSCHIDTPANNKLYEKMAENSIENFTFEVLDFCPINQLNEKEKYFIEFYQSYDYGFNSNRGISK